MNLAQARPSLTPSPFMPAADIVGASRFYFTDGDAVLYEDGSWPANESRDIFCSGNAVQTEPWHTAEREAGKWPTSEFGEYVGSINPDANGLLNWHVTPGPSRRCDIWSAINQEDIEIQVCDGDANRIINWSQGNWHPMTPNASATFVIGLPRLVRCLYDHTIYTLANNGSAWSATAIGWGPEFSDHTPWVWPDMTGMPPGKYGQTGVDEGGSKIEMGPSNGAFAHHSVAGFMGVQTVFPLMIAPVVIGDGSYVNFCGRNEPAEWIMRVQFRG